MATINAATTISVKKKVAAPTPPKKKTGPSASTASGGASTAARRGSVPPPLKPKDLATPTRIAALQSESDAAVKKERVLDLLARALGAPPSALSLGTPHTASTTRDRGQAAADLAVAAKHLSVRFVLKECGVLNELQRHLFPDGIETLLTRGGGGADGDDASNENSTGGGGAGVGFGTIRPSTSSLSLSSLCLEQDNETMATTAANSANTDSKRGKTIPAAAREGSLLVLRALTETVGKPVEPYICGAFLAAALDECASTNSSVREAAEDAVTSLTALANPWSFSTVMAPIVRQTLSCTEWRVKTAALECLVQLAALAPAQVHPHIPNLIPVVANQVWDTKPQVSKGAKAALLAICETNNNTDVKPAIPWVVNAICKPSETNKAISELMCTTFVVPVDASTLAILCPVLARALKEKLAIHKRAACIVISNMAKLVDSPASVAPFGSLLVPELQKVAANVQFEEIRDESLKALSNLTKALGDQYKAAEEAAAAEANKANAIKLAAEAAAMELEQNRADAEQLRIQQEREALAAEEEAHKLREAEERKRFKEAMDAQRALDQIAAEEAASSAAAEQQKKEMLKLSTKSATGTCQACGLKKCKKTCNFYTP
jgi:hypothetical protein